MFNKSQTLFLLPIFFLVLFFADVGQAADRTYCSAVNSSGACYTPEFVSNKTGAGCKFSNAYCKTCRQGWYPTGDSNPENRCTQTPPEKLQKVEVVGRSGRSLCKDAVGEWIPVPSTETEEDSSYCKCPNGAKLDVLDGDKGKKCEQAAEKPADDPNKRLAELCTNKGGKWIDAGDGSGVYMACSCPGYTSINPEGSEKCAAAAVAESETNAQKIDRIGRECGLIDAQNTVAACGDKAFEAVDKCEKDYSASSNTNQQIKGLLTVVGGVQQKNAVANADPDACGKAAYGSTAAYWAMDAFKKTCEDTVAECKKACNPLQDKDSFNKMLTRCENQMAQELGPEWAIKSGAGTGLSAQLNSGVQSKQKNEKQTEGYQTITSLRGIMTEIKNQSERNLAKCETDAVGGGDRIGSALTDLLQASMSAAACKNAASNSAARCAALASQLSPAYCLNKPTEPCCAPFIGGTLDCASRDYTNRTCVCARTPDAGVCKTSTASTPTQLTNPGGVSGLAAPGGITSGNLSKPTGVVPGGGIDVGTDDASKLQQNAGGTGGSTNPFASAGGAGGGGGGGLPNSPNDGNGPAGAAAAGEGSSSSGAGGAFNQLKTWADKMMGGGSGSNASKNYGDAVKGKDPKKAGAGIDPNKWRPGLRGVAGGSEFGPRNKDIWKTMNAQYGIQNHTFLGLDGN